MTGIVAPSLDLLLTLTLRGVSGDEREIECVPDTGFDGEIGLPAELIAELQSPRSHSENARLADGSLIQVDVHEVDIEWEGRWTTVFAESLGSALVGTRLCSGYRLEASFRAGDVFTLNRLST